MEDQKTHVIQNTGVLDQGSDDELEVVNGETVPPGSSGGTEGGMPSGTPPVAPNAGGQSRTRDIHPNGPGVGGD